MIIAIIPSRNRSKTLRNYTYNMIKDLGIDFLIGVEKSQEGYDDFENLIRFEEDNIGLCKSLDILKKEAIKRGATLIWKMDDDMKRFTNNLKENISILENDFDKYEKLGAIVFPYSHEFYYPEDKLYSHYNARTQTSYLIRTELLDHEFELTQFEDFYQFINLRTKGYYTLLCSRHKMECLTVGKAKGGYQDFDRRYMAWDSIIKLQNKYPRLEIGIKEKPEKNWYYEPVLNHPLLKKKKII